MTRFVVLGVAFIAIESACGGEATAPPAPPVPIRGHIYDVSAIGGRPIPTSLFALSIQGTCRPVPVTRMTIEFREDYSLLITFTDDVDTGLYNSTYTEPVPGEQAVFFSKDTAFVTGSALKVRPTGVFCAREELVATRRG